jgi:hypothetical protein
MSVQRGCRDQKPASRTAHWVSELSIIGRRKAEPRILQMKDISRKILMPPEALVALGCNTLETAHDPSAGGSA